MDALFLARGAALAVALALGAAAVPAPAALVTIDDPNSAFTVTYNDEDIGAFGAPSVLNNRIIFRPDDFSAVASGENGVGFTTDTLNLTIEVKAEFIGTFSLDAFLLSELGDYIMTGAGSSVGVTGQMQVEDLDMPGDVFTEDLVLSGPLDIRDGSNPDWSASATIDQADGWATGAVRVNLLLQNNLLAQTQNAGDFAFIQKKHTGIEIAVVPVPGALWMFGSALLALVVRRR